MIDNLIKELKDRFKDKVPIEDAVEYVKMAFNFGELKSENSFKFRRFDKEYVSKFSEFKYIPNPYNGGDDDFIIADMIRKEYTYGEYGSELFSDINALNRDFYNYTIKELIKEQYKMWRDVSPLPDKESKV